LINFLFFNHQKPQNQLLVLQVTIWTFSWSVRLSFLTTTTQIAPRSWRYAGRFWMS